MNKDPNNIERKEGTEPRMTAFQRAMAEKNGNAGSRPQTAPPARQEPVRSSASLDGRVRSDQPREPVRRAAPPETVAPDTAAEQPRTMPVRETVRPIPLTPPEGLRRAVPPQKEVARRGPAVPTRGQAPAMPQSTGVFTPVSVPKPDTAEKKPARPAVNRREIKAEQKTQGSVTPSAAAQSEKKQAGKGFLRDFFSLKEDPYVQKRISSGRRIAIVIFVLATILALIACTWGSYSVSGLSIRENSQIILANKSDSKNYRIVYSAEDAFGADAAASLQSHLLAKTGATLSIVPDTEAPAKNEIRIGYTKRAPDSYITSLGSLGKNGYAIIFGANGGVDLIAFSRVGAEAAIMCFTDGYGVSYLAGNLNFASSSNLAYVSRDGTEPDTSLYEGKLTLGFGSDSKFKMLVFSDPDINTNTISAMEAMLDGERPDLVILCGDVSSGISTKSELEEYLRVLCAPMESRKIAWCHINGEQDGDAGLSATLQNEVYSSFKYCVSKSDFESFGASSYFLPVFADSSAEKGSAPLFGVWMLGQTGLISSSPVAPGVSDGLLTSLSGEGKDYGYVPRSHVDWLSDSASLMKKDREKGIPSIAVTHTPVDEFNIIAENPDKCAFDGVMAEKVSASPVQSGLFAALLEAKSVLGLYCGHDHLNNFSGKYLGIELGYAASVGYDGYGHGGTFENNNSARGGRVIEATLIGESVSVSSRFAFASEYGITRE